MSDGTTHWNNCYGEESAMNIQERVMKELGVALKQFGTYSFDDKGPNEVMDLNPFIDEFLKMPRKDAAEAIIEIASSKKYKGRGLTVAMHLVTEMQDCPELFEIAGIDDILNGDLPNKPSNVEPVRIECMNAKAFLMSRFAGN